MKLYIDMCLDLARLSPDHNRKVGAIIVKNNEVMSCGYNHPQSSCSPIYTPHRYDPPLKYDWFIHAEMNAICEAAQFGKAIAGATMYSSMFPCSRCASLIVQSGIIEVVVPEPEYEHKKYGESFHQALIMLRESNVTVNYKEYKND